MLLSVPQTDLKPTTFIQTEHMVHNRDHHIHQNKQRERKKNEYKHQENHHIHQMHVNIMGNTNPQNLGGAL
jgi:hypothetical protein